MHTFDILLQQIGLFIIYILAGVILVRTRVLSRETLEPISKFVLKMDQFMLWTLGVKLLSPEGEGRCPEKTGQSGDGGDLTWNDPDARTGADTDTSGYCFAEDRFYGITTCHDLCWRHFCGDFFSKIYTGNLTVWDCSGKDDRSTNPFVPDSWNLSGRRGNPDGDGADCGNADNDSSRHDDECIRTRWGLCAGRCVCHDGLWNNDIADGMLDITKYKIRCIRRIVLFIHNSSGSCLGKKATVLLFYYFNKIN